MISPPTPGGIPKTHSMLGHQVSYLSRSRDSRTEGMGVQMVLFVWKGSPFLLRDFDSMVNPTIDLWDEQVWTEMGSPNFLGRIVQKSEPGNPSAVKLLMEEIRLTSW